MKKKVSQIKNIYKEWKKVSLDNKGFFIIFNGFLDNGILRDITGGALKLYVYLGIKSDNSTGESFYTIAKMAEYFEVSERTIANWLKELEKLHLIIRYQLKFNGVSHTYLNIYDAGNDRGKRIEDPDF